MLTSWVDARLGTTSRWRVVDLRNKLTSDLRVSVGQEALHSTLHTMVFSHASPRPLHAKADPAKQETFRTDFHALALDAVSGKAVTDDIEIWFQDEIWAGQQGHVVKRQGAPRQAVPHSPGSALRLRLLFAAARPEDPVAVGHVFDCANTDEMNSHLADISKAVRSGRHGVTVLHGAGWHRSNDLATPDSLTLLRLPPYSPELNPIENLFGFLEEQRSRQSGIRDRRGCPHRHHRCLEQDRSEFRQNLLHHIPNVGEMHTARCSLVGIILQETTYRHWYERVASCVQRLHPLRLCAFLSWREGAHRHHDRGGFS